MVLGLILAQLVPARPSGGTTTAATALPPAVAGPSSGYFGTVSQSDGRPAPGCEVLLIRVNVDSRSGRELVTKVVETTSTDARGHFAFRTPRPQPMGPQRSVFSMFSVFVRDAKNHIGWPERPKQPQLTPLGMPDQPELRFRLVDVGPYRGRLLDASGQPIAKAAIEPYMLSEEASSEPGRNWNMPLYAQPPAGAGTSPIATAADGSFVIPAMPAQGMLGAKIDAPSFGNLFVSWNLAKPFALRLQRAGSVSGRFVFPADQAAVGSLAPSLYQAPEVPSPRSSQRPDFHLSYYGRATVARDGSFRFDGVPPGKYALAVTPGEGSPYYTQSRHTEPPKPFEVKPGQDVRGLTIELKRGILVSGKIVDGESGVGVAGVELYFNPTERRSAQFSGPHSAETDAQGRYRIYLSAGKYQININFYQLREDYLQPSPRDPQREVEVAGETIVPPIPLKRAAVIAGLVVDESGAPVPGVEVLPLTTNFNFFFMNQQRGPAKSDSHGKFTLKGMPGTERVAVRARSDTMVSDGPLMVDPKGPIRLVVSPKYVVGLRGRLIDDRGSPVAGAVTHLNTMWSSAAGGIGFTMKTAATDSQGRFEFSGLWPGDEYHVAFEHEGFDKQETAVVTGRAGKTHDFGPIMLIAARGTVEGKIVDSSGKPVAGARVFNTGDGPQTVSVASDSAGRFHLAGLHGGPVYVFVDQPGYRFTAARASAGATGVTVTLLRKDQPAPRFSGPPLKALLEDQRKLAHELLETVWAQCDHAKLQTAVVTMCRIDPELARKWSAEAAGRYDAAIRGSMLSQIADEDLDEAFAQIHTQRQWVASLRPFKSLAERYAKSDPDKAMRCAEEMVVRARAMDQPARTTGVAQAGQLVARLGNAASGRTLIEEAAAMIPHLGPQRNFEARGAVAQALAAYDVKRAVALMPSKLAPRGSDQQSQQASYEQMQAVTNLAAAICVAHPDEAGRLVAKLEPWFADRAKIRMACRMATARPDDAMTLLDGVGASQPGLYGSENWEHKAAAFGWVAGAIAPRDKARACALVDRALAGLSAPRDPRFGPVYGNGLGAIEAGTLVLQAARIGHPDMRAVVGRALAARLCASQSYSPVQSAECNAQLAALLAMADPATARDVLQWLEPQSAQLAHPRFTGNCDCWVLAWLVAEPARGRELFQRKLTELKAKPGDYQFYQLLELAHILVLPVQERIAKITRYSDITPPEEE
jgi:protocatechuate 3,4-dioxygenase beta subunit